MIKRFQAFKAPSRYYFTDPDSKHEYKAGDKYFVIQQVEAYRRQNGLEPIEALDVVIDNYNCERPENCGACEEVAIKRGWLKYVRGGMALFKMVLFQRFADQATADKRAAQCISCKFNKKPKDNKGFAEWADEIAKESTNGRKSKYYDLLQNCEVCSCVLKAKVFYMDSISITEEEEVKMKEVNCWQLKLPRE